MALSARSTIAALLLVACTPPPKPPETSVPGVAPSAAPYRDPSALPPPTAMETEVERELAAELSALLALGERAYYADGLDLADATDHVAGRLESFGYEVRRKGFTHEDMIAQNIEVEVPGLRRGNQLVIVSARLDSVKGSMGADDNATGVAALLVLARRFRDQRALRTMRFVFFSSAGPRDEREAQGAYHYAQALRKEEETPSASAEEASAPAGETESNEPQYTTEVVATVELRGLGIFDTRPGSQRYPETTISSDDTANFLALVSISKSGELAAASGAGFESTASVPLEHWVLLPDDAFFVGSPAFEFLDKGFPTLVYTDTQTFRSDKLGTNEDDEAHLDRSRMVRAVAALEPALMALSGPRGDVPEPNPEGLTPPGAPTSPAPATAP
jgi:hypothetical protein